jgi:uncharacterized protein HemX
MENPTEIATELMQSASKTKSGKTLAIAALTGVVAAGAARFGWKKFRNRKETPTEATTETETPDKKK